jgi:hypothetical protein
MLNTLSPRTHFFLKSIAFFLPIRTLTTVSQFLVQLEMFQQEGHYATGSDNIVTDGIIVEFCILMIYA